MQTPSSRTIWFESQSDSWFAGLPVGNGRTGAMVTGGVPAQSLHLNDETYWSPGPRERSFLGGPEAMNRVRELLSAGDVLGAQAAAKPLLGDPALGAALQPVGDILLSIDLDGGAARFFRSLDLSTGLATFRWDWDDGRFLEREIVASRDPSIFVVSQTSNIVGVPTQLGFDSPFPFDVTGRSGPLLIASGQWREVTANRELVADSYRLRDYSQGVHLRFAMGASVLEGEASWSEDSLALTSSDWAVAIAVRTDYSEQDPTSWILENLAAISQPVDELFGNAIAAHSTVFSRSTIQLETGDATHSLSTDRRVHAVRAGGVDDDLAILVADYGRYLQIASTLGGTLPPTLQGIWNADTEPAWSSNYTLNINLQMNLWSADAFHFPEALDVLRGFVQQLALAGRRTASELYGANGWVLHHNSDLWMNTAPTTLVEVGLFAGAGLWLVQQLQRHHESYPELSDASTLFELLSGAIEFLETWLVVDGDGFLATSPSSSPENGYLLGSTPRPSSRAEDPEYWRHGWLGEASTLDMILVRDTLASAIELGHRLNASESALAHWGDMLARLRPIVLQDGELPEWTWSYRALELGHRHLSPLYGLYPGTEDFPAKSELHEAARLTLSNRQANVTSSSNGWGGWSKVWAAACWARLGEGDRALASIESLLRTGIAPDSLLHAFPDFDGAPGQDAVHQSDANLGLSAAISELLVGGTIGAIRLLPALPARWHAGRADNIRVPGGVDVTFTWSNGLLDEAHFITTRDQTIDISAPGTSTGERISHTVTLQANTPLTVTRTDNALEAQKEPRK